MHRTLFLSFSFAVCALAQRPTVTLNDAIYVGTTTQVPSATAAVDVFLGIPYGAKPERFGAAQLLPKGTEKRDAISQPPACIQGRAMPIPGLFPKESEDCLFLHVFAPKIPANASKSTLESSVREGKPVMVFIHGGALMMGGIGQGDKPASDGSYLAANQDVISVAISYRLGVFGFPGDVPGLKQDELNPGFRDQTLALKWVQENIAAFGGDPKKVTLFGQSGGAVSVDSHLVSGDLETPPFRAAISQSGGLHVFTAIIGGIGPYVTGIGSGNVPGEAPFITLAKALNCSVADAVACARSKSVAEIKATNSRLNLQFSPVDDGGKTMTVKPDNARRAKKTTKVPVMIGATFQEALMFSSQLSGKSLAEWAAIIYPKDQTKQKEIEQAYAVGPGTPFKSTAEAALQLHSDYQFQCIAAYEAQMIAASGVLTYRYIFNASNPSSAIGEGDGLAGFKDAPKSSGAGHGSELSFVWGTPQRDPGNAELSKKIQKAWADFAKDPSKGPGWAAYGSGEKDLADLGGEGDRKSITMIKRDVMDSRCHLFWDSYDPERPKRKR